MPLILEVEPGDALHIGSGTVVTVVKKKGQRTRLSIESDYKVRLDHGGAKPAKPEKPDTSKPAIPFERPTRT